jgi:hypothetical protein
MEANCVAVSVMKDTNDSTSVWKNVAGLVNEAENVRKGRECGGRFEVKESE